VQKQKNEPLPSVPTSLACRRPSACAGKPGAACRGLGPTPAFVPKRESPLLCRMSQGQVAICVFFPCRSAKRFARPVAVARAMRPTKPGVGPPIPVPPKWRLTKYNRQVARVEFGVYVSADAPDDQHTDQGRGKEGEWIDVGRSTRSHLRATRRPT
jgi:hypothetical protein